MQGAGKLEIIKISDILPNRFQPRIKFDDEALNQLSISIARFGVIEPIVVRPIGKKYEIIAGERRFKASKLAGKSTIPCIIVNLSDKDSEELALLENVQRKALSPIEEAVSYKKILDSGYITREELSKKIGKPQSLIFSKIKLLSLADEVQNYLLNNKISEGHARSLLQLNSLKDQVKMLHRIVDDRLTVKATDREIDKILRDKRNIKTDDEIENLFDDERGKEKMDIDKIMQEAKDINVEQAPNIPQAPNLMEGLKDVPSAPLSSPSDVQVNEPSKFVSVKPEVSSPSAPAPSAGVTFDNMFAAPLNAAPSLVPESQPVSTDSSLNNTNSANVTPEFNSLMNGVTPLVQPSVAPAPDLISPMNEVKSGDDNLAAFSGGIIPNSFNGSAQANTLGGNEPIVQPSVTPGENTFVNEQPVPQAVTPVDAVPTPLVENNDNSNLEQVLSPLPDSSSNVQSLEASNLNEAVSTNSNVGVIPEVPISNMNQPISTENVIPEPTHVDSQRVVITEQPEVGGQSISDAVSSAFKNVNNVPDVNIYQNPVQPEVSPVVPEAPVSQNVVTEQAEIPAYVKAINKLRECAEELRKSGFYINTEEVDIEGQYKVIFTIDK